MKSAVAAASPAPAVSHADMANAIRALAMDGVEAAKSGHPGMPMGMADVATVLYSKFLKFNATDPHWPDRDRFILSAGHGSMLLYALGYLAGYEKMTLEQLKKFRQLHSLTPGHPEVMVEIGAETTTGPLGQGLANATGFALAERMLHARFGDDLVNHYTYVIAGDGDLMEGISHEAASLAGHLKLGRLIVFYDDNAISIDGPTSLSFTDHSLKRFEAYGWHTVAIDGHDAAAIERAISEAQKDPRPSLIACKTIIGFGAPKKAGTKDCHGSPLGADEIAGAREKLGWPHGPFMVPENILAAWRQTSTRNAGAYDAWKKRHAASAQRPTFDAALTKKIPAEVHAALAAVKAKAKTEKPKLATRQSSGTVLEALLPVLPELVGGSADLTPSNNTQVKAFASVKPGDYAGRYIHYGVREHAMAAAMNGMALHGGFIPYGGTFLQFADYCRPAIRLSALMKQQVIYIMTHDSIGLGEDGPTHQPVEHLSALRVIPNLLTFRPCDTVETAECWEIALQQKNGPSLLALSRQNLPTLRTESSNENLSARGGYVLAGGDARNITLLATGSEVSLAAEAAEKLKSEGINAAIVSLPCMELFMQQDEAYRKTVLGSAPRVVIEAGMRQSWDRFLREGDSFIGMSTFGESAPAPDLYKHFGITVENITETCKKMMR